MYYLSPHGMRPNTYKLKDTEFHHTHAKRREKITYLCNAL
jgi:hypothetical protein